MRSRSTAVDLLRGGRSNDADDTGRSQGDDRGRVVGGEEQHKDDEACDPWARRAPSPSYGGAASSPSSSCPPSASHRPRGQPRLLGRGRSDDRGNIGSRCRGGDVIGMVAHIFNEGVVGKVKSVVLRTAVSGDRHGHH